MLIYRGNCLQLEALAFPQPTSKWLPKWLKRGENEEVLKKRQKDLEVHAH